MGGGGPCPRPESQPWRGPIPSVCPLLGAAQVLSSVGPPGVGVGRGQRSAATFEPRARHRPWVVCPPEPLLAGSGTWWEGLVPSLPWGHPAVTPPTPRIMAASVSEPSSSPLTSLQAACSLHVPYCLGHPDAVCPCSPRPVPPQLAPSLPPRAVPRAGPWSCSQCCLPEVSSFTGPHHCPPSLPPRASLLS